MNPVERWRDDISERLDTYGDRRETFGEMQALRDAASVVRSSPIPPEVAELVEVVRLRGCHTESCAAYKVAGRFGSRSGLRWQQGDAAHCTCDMAALAKWEPGNG